MGAPLSRYNGRRSQIMATTAATPSLDFSLRARFACEDEMYVPSARDIVEIAGLPDLFQVLWVNESRKRADLLAVRERPYAVPDVPFARLRPFQAEPEAGTE